MTFWKGVPRPTLRGGLWLGAAAAFLGLHHLQPSRHGTFLDWLIPPSDRILPSVAWFILGTVALSIVMVSLAKVLCHETVPGKSHSVHLTASSSRVGNEALTGWGIGLARQVPLVSAWVTWVGEEFLQVSLDKGGHELCWAERRGKVQNPKRQITFTDVFGLAKSSVGGEKAGPGDVTVYPKKKTPEFPIDISRVLSASEHNHSKGTHEGDRTESRAYRPGEPMRHMLWRVAARTGDEKNLYVRLQETAGEDFFEVRFLSGGHDQGAAELADYLLREDPWGGRWHFSIAGMPIRGQTRDTTQLRDRLAASAAWKQQDTDSAADPVEPDRFCILIAGPDDQLVEKLTGTGDPAKISVLLVAADDRQTEQVELMVSQLRAAGYEAQRVGLSDGMPEPFSPA